MIIKFKNILKKFWPVSIQSLNNQISFIIHTLNHQQKVLLEKEEQTKKQLVEQEEFLLKNIVAINENQQHILNKLNQVIQDEQAMFNRTKDSIIEEIKNKHTSQVDLILKQLSNSQEIFTNSNEKVITDLKYVRNTITNLNENISNKKIMWKSPFEKKVVKLNFGYMTENENFENRFMKLIRGLDVESITTITDIVNRQKQYLTNDALVLDLFYRDEQEQLRRLEDEFTKRIFKISEQLFCYKHYLLPVNHFEESVFYYKHGIHKLTTLEKLRNKSIIDVGGYIGDSVLIFSSLTDKTVYTFEAVPENYELMQKTFELNQIENVIAEQIALGSYEGTTTISVLGSVSSTQHRQGISYESKIQVGVRRLDDYVEEHNIEVGLIKVDIEGAEQDFLKGAWGTICKQKPILLISIYHNADDFLDIKPMIEDLNLGYTFSIYKPILPNLTSETLLIAEVCE